jgi:hypothetical protein
MHCTLLILGPVLIVAHKLFKVVRPAEELKEPPDVPRELLDANEEGLVACSNKGVMSTMV